MPSLPDELDAAGMTWGSYTSGYPFNLIKKLGTRNMKPQSDFAGDAAARAATQRFVGLHGPAGRDEHPSHAATLTTGMNWTVGLVDERQFAKGPERSGPALRSSLRGTTGADGSTMSSTSAASSRRGAMERSSIRAAASRCLVVTSLREARLHLARAAHPREPGEVLRGGVRATARSTRGIRRRTEWRTVSTSAGRPTARNAQFHGK